MRASKRDIIVETAAELIYRHWFTATGIDRVLADAKVAKMTLYNHFPSKDALIVEVLRRYDRTFRDRVRTAALSCAGGPREKLLCVFDLLAAWFAEDGFRGCLFINAAAEFRGRSQAIFEQACAHKRLITEHLAAVAAEAGAADPGALADQLRLLLEGAVVSAQVSPASEDGARWAERAREAAAILIDRSLAPAAQPSAGSPASPAA